jgi:hypothetical protein
MKRTCSVQILEDENGFYFVFREFWEGRAKPVVERAFLKDITKPSFVEQIRRHREVVEQHAQDMLHWQSESPPATGKDV